MLEDFKIDRTSEIPVSKQIAGNLRKLVFSGKLKPGDRLPTVQKLAHRLGVGSRTASEALKFLQAEGILEANPRRGTFVRDFRNSQSPSDKQKQQKNFNYLRIAVIKNNGKHLPRSEDSSLEIMKGIFSEGDRYNSVIQVLPESIIKDSADRIFNEIVNFGSRAVIWLTPDTEDWETLEYLRSHNIPVVIARRWRYINGGCCVQADFNSAGFETGEKFIESGCDKVLIFDDSGKSPGRDINQPGSFAMSIREGIIHSFLQADKYGEGKVKIEKLNFEDPQAARVLLHHLEGIDAETGIVFCNVYKLMKVLENEADAIRKELSGKNFAVVSYSLVSNLIIRRLSGLNFWLLKEPLEDIGKAAVQKALSIHQGYLSDTASLVKVKLEPVSW